MTPRRLRLASTLRAGLGPPAPLAVEDRSAINVAWLIRLRWAAVVGQLTTILVVHFAFAIALPLGPLAAVLAVEVATNVALLELLRRHRAGARAAEATGAEPPRLRAQLLQVGVMVLDTLLLFTLLALTGGTANPFCVFFLVHVVLAAVLLRPRYTLGGAGFVALCVAALRVWHRPLPALAERPELTGWGTAVAVALTSLLVAFFIARVAGALVRRSRQLQAERERQDRARHLEALGTLAAGAAHELGTPLSTIAVVAKELERSLERQGAGDEVLGDARLVREEVARCRRILDRMNHPAGEQAGEPLVDVDVVALCERTLEDLADRDRVQLEVAASAHGVVVRVPLEGLATALRSIVQNALDASPPDRPVRLRALGEAGELVLTVRDEGEGMDPDQAARATEPFYTTKEPGRGMGLGLYLSRSVLERLGGSLELRSARHAGTTARVSLPLAGLRRDAAADPGDRPD